MRTTMLKLLGVSSEFTSVEEASVNHVASAHADAGNSMQDGANSESCAAYLAAIEACATQLQLSPASRTYRTSLPLNYRSLFPTDARSYRVDVLEASLEHYNIIWVNGEKFVFSADVTRKAQDLQVAYIDLGTLLDRWSSSPKQGRPTRDNVVSALQALDSVWASFEEQYIGELVQIEAKARNHIVHAIELERRLQHLETFQDGQDKPEYREVLRCLVSAVSHLNTVANVNRKGRDDLKVDILTEAQSILRKCSTGDSSTDRNTSFLAAAKVLATDVVGSFNALRQYLCDVTYCLERVDPHLGNNSGLVDRLVDWEESWEVGATYLQQPAGLSALCDAVSDIHRLKASIPKLAEMLEECDAELFLVLPRLVWLRFLAEPSQLTPLLQRLLPHRFVAAAGTTPRVSKELEVFVERHAQVGDRLRNLLAERAVSGESDDEHPTYASMVAAQATEAQEQVESFMLELEAWSMELQRHCPEDWNQYISVLVHCLTTETEKKRKGPFGI